MDITKFVVSSREAALLYGDYATYRSQLSKRLLKCRRRLNLTTKNRAKYHDKSQVTSQQLSESHDYLHLLLMTSERAWAHAMSMRSTHAADNKGITGHTRSHIVSRLDKASKTAERLVDIVSQRKASGATQADTLEARAYAALMRGATQFEKQAWEPCLRTYSTARVIYSALATSTKSDTYKDLLSETIDPSIRYAAYQLKTPRTLPIPIVARKAFPRSDEGLVTQINDLDPSILKPEDVSKKNALLADNAPKTLTWRSREVKIEDAAIAVAWASLGTAKARLSHQLSSSSISQPKDAAAHYDDVLTASQDAADATKQAIDELKGEGIGQSDPRMQSLQITRTAVNYEMISWRIGRNRVLAGDHDGALLELESKTHGKAKKKQVASEKSKEDTPRRQITRLKEKVALYDLTLQSLESIRELPGVAADEGLSAHLNATFQYFNALKCLSIARSYSIIGEHTKALALMRFAFEECQRAVSVLTHSTPSDVQLRNIDVGEEDVTFLLNLLKGEQQRSRALVEIDLQRQKADNSGANGAATALIDKLHEYPSNGVDLENIVPYPPKVECIPIKPLFLDVAWNYIDYPNKQANVAAKGNSGAPSESSGQTTAQTQKRGWWGFGRS